MRVDIVGRDKAKPHCADTRRRTCLAVERRNALPLIAPYGSEVL
jgi:hypothetical protein